MVMSNLEKFPEKIGFSGIKNYKRIREKLKKY